MNFFSGLHLNMIVKERNDHTMNTFKSFVAQLMKIYILFIRCGAKGSRLLFMNDGGVCVIKFDV